MYDRVIVMPLKNKNIVRVFTWPHNSLSCKLLTSHSFTCHYSNTYIIFLIKFKFYFIFKPAIKILAHHIYNSIYKHSYNYNV